MDDVPEAQPVFAAQFAQEPLPAVGDDRLRLFQPSRLIGVEHGADPDLEANLTEDRRPLAGVAQKGEGQSVAHRPECGNKVEDAPLRPFRQGGKLFRVRLEFPLRNGIRPDGRLEPRQDRRRVHGC